MNANLSMLFSFVVIKKFFSINFCTRSLFSPLLMFVRFWHADALWDQIRFKFSFFIFSHHPPIINCDDVNFRRFSFQCSFENLLTFRCSVGAFLDNFASNKLFYHCLSRTSFGSMADNYHLESHSSSVRAIANMHIII